MDNNPAPGWYADPYNSEYIRWWDGQAWGENIYPAPIKSPITVEDSNSFPVPSSPATYPNEFPFSAPELSTNETLPVYVEQEDYQTYAPDTQNVQPTEEFFAPAVYTSQDIILPTSAYQHSGDVKKDSVLVSTNPTDFVNDMEGMLIAKKKKRIKNLKFAIFAFLLFISGGAAVYVLSPIVNEYVNQ